jgi:hypothetical protein
VLFSGTRDATAFAGSDAAIPRKATLEELLARFVKLNFATVGRL